MVVSSRAIKNGRTHFSYFGVIAGWVISRTVGGVLEKSAILRKGGQNLGDPRKSSLGGGASLANRLSGSSGDSSLIDFACCSHVRDGASVSSFRIRTFALDTPKIDHAPLRKHC